MPTALPLLAIAYCLGVALGDAALLSPTGGRAALLAAGGGLLLALWRRRGSGLALLALALALGAAAQARRTLPPSLRLDGPVRADAVVVSAPEPGPTGTALQVSIDRMQPVPDGPWHNLRPPARAALSVRGALQEPIEPGDRVRLRAVLRPPDGFHNPGAPDPRRRASADGVHLVASVDSMAIVPWDGPPSGRWLPRAVARLRARLLDGVRARLQPSPEMDGTRFGLVAALALGARGELRSAAPEMEEAFRRAGVYHVLSVSGLHLAAAAFLCYGGLLAVLRRVPSLCRRIAARRVAALCAIPATLLYTALTGAAVATVRAAGVAVLCFLAIVCGRRARLPEALAGAVLWILGPWGTPLAMFDPALQLSVAATLGVVYLGPRWRIVGPGALRRLACAGLGILSAAIGATLATAPLCALHFGEFHAAGLLGNLCVVPLGELLVLPAGLLGAALSIGSPILGGYILYIAGLAAAAMAGLARWIAGLGLFWAVPSPGLLSLGLWGSGMVLLARRRRAALLLAGVGLAVYLVPQTLPRHELRATFLDIGQGDAAVLELPGGAVMVVDGGGAVQSEYDPGQRVLLPYLQRRGIRRVDLAVLSHPHPDHAGGLLSLLEHLPVGMLWTAETGRPRHEVPREPLDASFLRLIETARRRGVLLLPPRPLDLGPVHIEPLWPCAPGPGCTVAPDPGLGHNDNSLVLRITYAGRSLLLPGDLELRGELRLLEQLDGRPDGAALRRADVLKVPHHGSRTSSSESLLREVAPCVAICSLGRRNRHGFPHPEVVARYDTLGVPLWRTDQRGAITVHIARDGALKIDSVLNPPR